jgi:hypothetical protein
MDINLIKTQFVDKIGKKDSLYTIVLFNCSQSTLLEFTKKQMLSITKIKDSYKRARANKAYYLLKQYAEEYEETNKFNVLILMDVENDVFNDYKLTKLHLKLLSSYKCNEVWLKCSNIYDFDELEDYLESDISYNLFRVKNNSIRYTKLGKGKKILINSLESKTLNLEEYITSYIGTDKYLVYGVSSKLSALSKSNSDLASNSYAIINHDVSDSEAIEYIGKMDQSNLLDEFYTDLDLINNSKTMDRIIFKKDFSPANLAKLQYMYIDKRIKDKFYKNCQKNNIDISFGIKVIDHLINDFDSGRELRLMNDYGGVVGLTYY